MSEVTFTTQGRASKRGRYVIAESASVALGAPGERTGVGTIPGKDGSDALVHEHGATQTAVPLYAVAAAVASGKVIPVAAVVAAFRETDQLAHLKREVLKALPDTPPPAPKQQSK